jgi:hypothetical protein
MLDNSFGPWAQYYTEGVEKTWATNIKKQDFYFRYVGKIPKIESINRLLNKFLNSRYKSIGWKFNLVKHPPLVVQAQFIDTSKVQVDVRELWSNITVKTISAIDFAIKNFEFDFIIRGNSSLYLDTKNLEQFLVASANTLDYAGPVIGSKKFVSGWCIILSRRAAQILVENFQKEDSLLFDDEAIGAILRRNGVEITATQFEVFDHIPTKIEIQKSRERGNWIWRFKDDSRGKRISISAMKLFSDMEREEGRTL